MNTKLLASVALTGVVLGTAGLASASSGPSARAGAQSGATPAAAAAAPEARAESAVSCNGKAVTGYRSVQDNVQFVFNETTPAAEVQIPGATVTFNVPANAKRTVVVDFSAETQLRNVAATSNFDWLGLNVYLDGVLMQPNDAGTPVALNGSPQYQSNAIRFCMNNVGPGAHVITAKAKIIDNGSGANVLQAWIDDWTLGATIFGAL